jgi:hypothetical protein
MIGKKINQLATELAPASTDLTIIGNPTTGVSKKITLAQLGAIFSGAVSFYTNYAAFPTPGTTDVIFCAKDTQKLYLWSGSAYVEVFPSQALLDTYQLRSEKGVSNGYASLDSSGKVPISQLPSSIMEYKGTWSAATNTPTLANGTGDTGDVYLCNAAGTVNFGAGPITFAVGDYVVYSGTIWQRSSGAVGTVTSVAASITGDAIGITGSPVTTSGTLAFAFGGNSTQYINGAGNLVTFPGVINEAQNLITEVYNKTGATLTKGTVVYINGGQGNLPSVTKALATGDSTSAQTYGIVRNDITNNNNGYVVVAGRISDLDTQAYTEGTQLYLSPTTAGTWTSTKPYAPNHLVYVGIVVRAHPTQGIVEIKIQNGYEMDELHNVSAQSPDNNDILQYKTATSLWTKVAGTTSNIAEGSNLYYTDARSRAALSFTAGSGAYNSTTGVITIPTNTNQLTNGAAFITLASLSAGAGISYNNTTGVIASTITQYTDALARAAISLTTTGTSGAATYNSTTGVLNVPQYAPDLSGYVPTSRTLTINGTAYDLSANRSWSVGTVTSVGLSSATSGVTIGSSPVTTSGTITLAIATASGSQNGLLSSTDWTTFNNKQSALTNPVTGTGTTNYLPKFTGTSTIGNSIIQDASTYIDVAGYAFFRRGGKYLLLNPNYAGTTVYADIAAEAGMGLSLSANGVTKQLYIDTSGNLGLGVTPSAWGNNSKPLQMADGSIWGISSLTGYVSVGGNYYYDGNYKYIKTSNATDYYQYDGQHVWRNAPSGTAGNAISFTQAMTLDASGRLFVGLTSGYSNGVTIKGASDDYALTIAQSNASNAGWGQWADTSGNYKLARYGGGSYSSPALTIALTGAATFSSSVTGQQGVNVGANALGTDRMFQVSGTAFTSGTTQFGIVNNPTMTTPTTIYGYYGGVTVTSATNGYGIYIASAAGTITNKFGIYQEGTGDKNYFAGNVGIGTTNPLYKLVVSNGGAEGLEIGPGYAGGRTLFQAYNRSGAVYNAIDFAASSYNFSVGNVGIGTTSPTTLLELNRASTGSSMGMFITNSAGSTLNNSSDIWFGNWGGASISSIYNARISALNTDASSARTDLLFYTYGGTGAGSVLERMRITSGGNVGIGSTTASGFTRTLKINTASGTAGLLLADGDTDRAGFYIDAGTTAPAYLFTNDSKPLVFSVAGAERARITSGGNVEINTGSIKTGEPDTGYGRAAFKIGTRQSGTATDSGGYIPISIDGTVYFINLYTSTP